MKFFAALFAVLLTLSVTRADLIYGSGQGVFPTNSYQVDPHWTVVALPVSYTNYAVPYSAFNPAVANIPNVYAYWNGFNAGGGVTNYWLSPNTTSASMQVGSYNWIVAQTFTITTSYLYNFDFRGAGDNAISFYIDGSITGTNTETPTITGGTKIGGSYTNFSAVTSFIGSAYMTAGTHTAYMVLEDWGGNTAALITQSYFSAVPEPGTWAAAALLIGGAGYVRWRKRAKVA